MGELTVPPDLLEDITEYCESEPLGYDKLVQYVTGNRRAYATDFVISCGTDKPLNATLYYDTEPPVMSRSNIE